MFPCCAVAATRAASSCTDDHRGNRLSWWTTPPETIYRHGVGTTNADGLLTEQQVAAQSGLAAELVSSLIPRAAEASGDAAVYDEVGLWRAKVAKMLVDNGILMNLVRMAVHEPLTVEQLRATVEEAQKWERASPD